MLEKEKNSCHVDCEGLYADVEFENLTNHADVKNSPVLESLQEAYNTYKLSYVKNLILKRGALIRRCL